MIATGRSVAGGTVVVLLALGSAIVPSSAACYPESAAAAEVAAHAVRDWPGVYRAYVSYGICDDGAVAEAFSDSIANILAQRWETVGQLDELAKLHAKFRRFVLRHIDSLMTSEKAQMISRNARQHCPVGATALCAQIANRLRESAHG